MPSYRRTSDAAAQAAELKKLCLDAGVTGVRVTSSARAGTISVKWADGPAKATMREILGQQAYPVTFTRWLSNAAILDALRVTPRYAAAVRHLQDVDVWDVSEWACAASDVLDVEPRTRPVAPEGRLELVARCCTDASPEALRVVAQLRREGSDAPLPELVSVAVGLLGA